MAISSTRDKLRLTIGDNDTDAELFQDDELDWFLSEEADSIPNAALRAAYAAMAKFARAYDFETDGQRFWRGQQYGYWADFAKRLETQGASIGLGNAVSTIDITKIHRWSADVPNQDVSLTSSSTNPRRRYYGRQDDLP